MITELASAAGDVIAYFWFLGGQPQPLDYCQEANRRAHPLLLAGQPCEIDPSQLQPDDVGYYPNPVDRLQRSTPANGRSRPDSASLPVGPRFMVEAMPRAKPFGLVFSTSQRRPRQKTAWVISWRPSLTAH